MNTPTVSRLTMPPRRGLLGNISQSGGGLKRIRIVGALSTLLTLPAQGGVASSEAMAAIETTAATEELACALAAASTGVPESGLTGHAPVPPMVDPAAPEAPSGYRLGMRAVHARRYMVATANPLASQAGCAVLKAGGSAMDAAVAVQMVLGLVEPQSSGIGGGAFLLHYDARTRSVQAFDGRETAPAAASQNYLRWIGDTAESGPPQPSVRASGRAIGTPGTVRVLAMAHRQHGRLPWQSLFKPAIALATTGVPVPARMAAALAAAQDGLRHDADAVALYFDADGAPIQPGERFTNLPYARVLDTIARAGADAFYTGAIAQGMVEKIRITRSAWDASPITPGLTTLDDLAAYRARVREPVCTTYRVQYTICGMPPPSSGGVAVAAILGILEHFDLSPYRPQDLDPRGGRPDPMAVHLISEAARLAYADRDAYLADADFAPLPGGSWDALLNKSYLAQRAALIDLSSSMRTAQPGALGDGPWGVVESPEAGTSHVSIVDAQGNAVAMTTTIESSMGSYHVTQGFVLNNELTDFSIFPERDGKRVANRVAANKRPRSSMAPTLVFRTGADGGIGDLLMVTGSPGGATIIQYVVKTLVGVLDWGLDAQQSAAMVNFGASNSATTYLGGEHPAIHAADQGIHDPLVQDLLRLGHGQVSIRAQTSGIATILRTEHQGHPVWQGGVDPRREGVALGDGL